MLEDSEKRILVDLDALLDTRLGTLARIDPELAKQAAENEYLERPSDEMGILFKDPSLTERFYALYEKRDEDTLKASVCTRIVLMLHELTNSLESMMKDSPFVSDIEVHVNTWPYQLTKEIREDFELVIDHYVSVRTSVKMVEIPPEKQTVSYFKSQYSSLIFYDINKWLKEHVDEFKEVKMPTVSLFAPAIFHTKVPTQRELDDLGAGDLNPFDAVRISLAECIEVNFLPVGDFSIIQF